MFDRLKISLITTVSLIVVVWIGSGVFSYFTHSTPPEFTIKGIESNGMYARTVACSFAADDDYKIAAVSIRLDGNNVLTKNVKSRQCDLPFSIDTATIPDGQHVLDVEAVDSSYNSNTTRKKIVFTVDNTPLRVSFVTPEYVVDQGKTLHLKIQANKRLAKAETKLFSTLYSFYPESEESTLYECFIPVECDRHAAEYMVSVDIEDSVKNKAKLSSKVLIKEFEFKRQRGFRVEQTKLEQEKECSMSMKVLDDALNRWLAQSPKQKLWSGPFDYPIEVMRQSTPFGEIRMTPERGRYMHKGVDLINRPKCVVWAAQTGKVIIKDRFYLTGNTIVLDHGIGIFTLYAHLEDYADVEIGDTVKKGSPLGKLGMTGYATGYHLHWEMRVNNTPVDPTEWTTKVF